MELRPVAPRTDSRAIASWMVFTGDDAFMKVTFGVGASRPIQLNCAALKRTFAAPSRSSSGAVGTIRPSVVPSFAATLKMWLAASEAAAARHVARHHRRIAGNVLADMARHRAGVEIVGAGGRIADDHRNRLAAVERFNGLGATDARREYDDRSEQAPTHRMPRIPSSPSPQFSG